MEKWAPENPETPENIGDRERIRTAGLSLRSFELKAKTQKGRAFWAFYPFLLAIV